MSIFLFDTMSQADASAFTGADRLNFGLTSLAAGGVAASIEGATTVLTVAGRSLAFATTALVEASQAGRVLLASGAPLSFGGGAGETITGTSGDDVIHALGGDDRVDALAGHDWVFGGGGADVVDGGDGNDHLYGHGFYVSVGQDAGDVLRAGAGDDYVQGNSGSDTIDGGSGADRLVGGADGDRIDGGAGNDTVNGNLGGDLIDGGDGADLLRGGQGADTLVGGAGDDVLMGDRGLDRLTGGAGADTFRFGTSDGLLLDVSFGSDLIETVTDFADGVDHLAIGGAPALVVGGSALSATLAATVAQTLLAVHVGGIEVAAVGVGSDTFLFYTGGDGIGIDNVVRLQGVSAGSITAADFVG